MLLLISVVGYSSPHDAPTNPMEDGYSVADYDCALTSVEVVSGSGLTIVPLDMIEAVSTEVTYNRSLIAFVESGKKLWYLQTYVKTHNLIDTAITTTTPLSI